MYKNKKNTTKGFTLIELMVVIAIIGLLSSIVLVSLKSARDKANTQKIRSDMKALITALEFYKTDTGKYPYEDTSSGSQDGNYMSGMSVNNSDFSYDGVPFLSTILQKYIPSLPKTPYPINNSIISWVYRTNYYTTPTIFLRCSGDIGIPKYVIYVYGKEYGGDSFVYNAFSDWLPLELVTLSNGAVTPQPYFYCFSLK
jgi:prepilin-type N-terminal cleavage/methylation domain-containing protein